VQRENPCPNKDLPTETFPGTRPAFKQAIRKVMEPKYPEARLGMSSNSAPIKMTLADFTSPGLIVPRLRGQDTASVIQELSHALQREKRIPDLLPYYHAALNREFMVGTDMEAGMAFPHARLPTLKEVSFAFGRSDDTLSWGARATRSVRLVFLMAVPATDSTQYLLIISGLARLAKDSRLMEKLHAARDTFQIVEVLKQVELRTNAPSNLMKKISA
jgi:mannitol/fructose-specific phosphotransferase system IIA component (Ntr-type)